MPLKIYLADLTHVGIGSHVATEAFPLNIGLIASYAYKRFGADVEIELFKYPKDLQAALDCALPDVIGFSNYTWNSNLALHFTKKVKALSPKTLVVWGGTNYPFQPGPQEAFLRRRPELDIHIYYEGEFAFASIIERVLEASHPTVVLDEPFGSCQFIHPKTNEFVSGPALSRIRELDEIPSPYATGLLDKFFDGILTPLVETARGCPFRCNFCNAGDKYFNKVNCFSNEYVKEELSYIAKKASESDVWHVTFADNNFGMIPRDAHTAEVVHALQQEYGWPITMTVWTGKNSKERVIEVTRLLEKTIRISMSVQSMDPTVLQNVSRDNIHLDHYRAIAAELDRQGRRQHAEVVMPLPGETFESHINGLADLLDTRLQNIQSHTLQLLHGTPYKDDPDYIERYGYDGKFRLVPMDFSRFGDDFVFDVEEVGVETKDMSFDEYLKARIYLFTIDLCFNSGIFAPLIRFLQSENIAVSNWINHVFSMREQFAPEVQQVLKSFVADSKNELWDTEEELVAHYSQPDTFAKLVAGDVGGNVLFKHRVWMLTLCAEHWVKGVFAAVRDMLGTPTESQNMALSDLETYVSGTIARAYDPDCLAELVQCEFTHDIVGWLQSGDERQIYDFKFVQPEAIGFGLDEKDQAILRDAFRRYGTDIPGMVKMIQRVVTLPVRRPVPKNIAA